MASLQDGEEESKMEVDAEVIPNHVNGDKEIVKGVDVPVPSQINGCVKKSSPLPLSPVSPANEDSQKDGVKENGAITKEDDEESKSSPSGDKKNECESESIQKMDEAVDVKSNLDVDDNAAPCSNHEDDITKRNDSDILENHEAKAESDIVMVDRIELPSERTDLMNTLEADKSLNPVVESAQVINEVLSNVEPTSTAAAAKSAYTQPVFEDITEDEESEIEEGFENIELELDDLIDADMSKVSPRSEKSEKCDKDSTNGSCLKLDESSKCDTLSDAGVSTPKEGPTMEQEDKITSDVSKDVKCNSENVSHAAGKDLSVQNSQAESNVNAVSDSIAPANIDSSTSLPPEEFNSVPKEDQASVVRKNKLTARKSGKPVESPPLRINLHPIKNVTVKLSDVEEALDCDVSKELDVSKSLVKSNNANEDSVAANNSLDPGAPKSVAVMKKKRLRKNTYNFPGYKKKSKKMKMSDGFASSGSSADNVSLSDGDFMDFDSKDVALSEPTFHGVSEVASKNTYLTLETKPTPSSFQSSSSSLSRPISGKSNKMMSVLEMLHARNRQKAAAMETEKSTAVSSATTSSTTTTTTILVSPPSNKHIIDGDKRKGTPRKRRDDVICVSDDDSDEVEHKELNKGKKKREHLEGQTAFMAQPSSKMKSGSQPGQMKQLIQTSQAPVVMVVAQHSAAPGLRSLLPRTSGVSPNGPAATLLKTSPSGILTPISMVSTLPIGAKTVSMANLPPGVTALPLTSIPAGSQQAMTFFTTVPTTTGTTVTPLPPGTSLLKIPTPGSLTKVKTTSAPSSSSPSYSQSSSSSSVSSASSSSSTKLVSPVQANSDSLRALLVGKPYTLARVNSASLPLPGGQSSCAPMLFQMVTQTSIAGGIPPGSTLVPLPTQAVSLGSNHHHHAARTTGNTQSPKNISLLKPHSAQGGPPNGLSCLTPPKTPDTDCSSEVAVAATLTRPVTGQVEDSDVIPLCCCKINGASFNKLFSGVTYCQALDSVDNKVLGCCNKVTNPQLVRPGVKIPFMAVCEDHRKRLKLHQCCPGCGHFCTQGKFQQCRKECKSSVHNFHKQCMFYRGAKYYCPHCGEEAKQCEVELSMKTDTQPAGVKVLPRQAKRESEWKSGSTRMCAGNFSKNKSTKDMLRSSPLTLSNNKVLKTDGVPLGPDLAVLNKLCRCSSEDRPKKYRVLTKDMYTAAYEGDMEKVFFMLMDGTQPNARYEDHDDQTAMHAAATSGSIGTVFILEQFGAEIHAQDKYLRTPMMCAAENGNLKIVRFLAKAGARVEDRGEDGMTSMHYAAKAGYIDIIQYLLSTEKLDVNMQDDGGWTPIIWATESQLTDVVRFLLTQGSDPSKKDNEENTGLHWAAYSGSLDIAEMFLDLGCEIDTPNEHGDRPLHIAARQDHYDIVVLLLARGADVNLKNNKEETPVESCVNKTGQVWMALKVNQQLRSFAARKLIHPEKLMERDITMGREKNPIACVNAEDNELCPQDYLYIVENVETSPLNINCVITSLQSCRCKDDCSSLYCVCGRSSIKCWYDKMGRLVEEFNLFEPPLVFECNRACRCWVNCNNRVVQNGITCRLQMFRTNKRGWGVRTLMDIPKGTFVCEYIGELISDSEADRREDDSYLFDLDNKDGDTYCIDARKYGNIARFINHLCEPNLVPVKVFVEHQDLRFPRICFFSSREIKAYEELGFDYGEKFWIIKWKHFTCACQSSKCKYSSETIHKTLADYRLRYPEEQVQES